MGWDRPILTDSGGFQVVSLGDLRIVDDDGVTFRVHLDGSVHRFTPEHSIAVQEALGPDIAVAFDQPVFPSSPRAVVADATERTHRWAERSLRGAHADRPGAVRGRPGRAGAGPARGVDAGDRGAAVRRHQHRRAGRRRDGGAARGGARRRRRRARGDGRHAAALPHGPRARRRTCWRRSIAGSTCSTRCCRRGSRATASCGSATARRRRLNLRNERYRDDPRPVQEDCRCPLCTPLLAGVSGPPVPGQGAARVPPRDVPQPDLHPRLHGATSALHFAPEPSLRTCSEMRSRAVRMSRGEAAAKSA